MASFTPPTLLNTHRWASKRIGLLGGSFNPPHEGHVHISCAALKGLHLDFVWWLLTPQNPLKSKAPSSIEDRQDLSNTLLSHPKILVSDLERSLGTNITYKTVKAIKTHYPNTEFIWISGMDNARTLHKWHFWKSLLSEIPMVHLTRMPAKSLVKNCPLRMYNTRQKHVFIDKAASYPLTPGTTYWMMQRKMINISSTEIRQSYKKDI